MRNAIIALIALLALSGCANAGWGVANAIVAQWAGSPAPVADWCSTHPELAGPGECAAQ